MHLIVPFAGVLSAAGEAALRGLALPQLARLLARFDAAPAGAADAGDEFSLTPPHERALAAALGWSGGDGALPFAARAAAADGIDVAGRAWGLLTPVHQHVGTEQVSLADPEDLQLDEAASREAFGIVRGLFESEGFELAWGAPLRWYLAHPSLATLATASLDRVIGRNIDAWLPAQRDSRLLRRLQNEVQMLLYTHPFNDRREAAGLPTLNALWLSGCGAAQPDAGAAPALDARLRRPALHEDWPAWQAAWQALDAGPIAALQAAPAGSRLTLCGERRARSFAAPAGSLWRRAAAAWRRADPLAVLEAL